MADPSIKQAFVQLYQSKMNSIRKGDSSFHYDLENVGIQQGPKTSAAKKRTAIFTGAMKNRSKAND